VQHRREGEQRILETALTGSSEVSTFLEGAGAVYKEFESAFFVEYFEPR
jgi:hypothetical protein